MGDKRTPLITLQLVDPHKTKRRKFVCQECSMAYSLKHYRLLYDGKKISYFTDPDRYKFMICHDCLYEAAMKLKKEMNKKKIVVRLDLGDEEVLLTF